MFVTDGTATVVRDTGMALLLSTATFLSGYVLLRYAAFARNLDGAPVPGGRFQKIACLLVFGGFGFMACHICWGDYFQNRASVDFDLPITIAFSAAGLAAWVSFAQRHWRTSEERLKSSGSDIKGREDG